MTAMWVCVFRAFLGVDSEGFFRASIVSGHVRNAARRLLRCFRFPRTREGVG
jgi:hypothetical protein